MIRVDVEEYCHACLDFSPNVTTPVRYIDNANRDVFQTDTIIQCEHRKRCEAIRKYLERQMKAEPEVAG